MDWIGISKALLCDCSGSCCDQVLEGVIPQSVLFINSKCYHMKGGAIATEICKLSTVSTASVRNFGANRVCCDLFDRAVDTLNSYKLILL